ncbi:MAG TPA: diguanylate cyclase [Gemmatimonadaceae bacterium]|nr:diguanylate cyclase [Gemmatimonadaceae bacterium]
MSTHEHSILLITHDPADARLIAEAAIPADPPAAGAPRYRIHHVERLAEAAPRLDRGEAELILLDLTLPDANGMEALRLLRARARWVPIVVLTGANDEGPGMEAVRAGAQDYLPRGRMERELLRRTLRHALERHRLQAALAEATHEDALTGLYNRRGFLAHAERAVQLAQRKRRGLLLAAVDVEGTGQADAGDGRAAGHGADESLVAAAGIIGTAFRVSDIVARLEGGRFVALLLEADGSAAETVRERLRRRLEEHNAHRGHGSPLSLSIGIAGTSGDVIPTLEELLAEAEQALAAGEGEREAHARG